MKLYNVQVYARHGGCCEGASQVGIFTTKPGADLAVDQVLDRAGKNYVRAETEEIELDTYCVLDFVDPCDMTDEELRLMGKRKGD